MRIVQAAIRLIMDIATGVVLFAALTGAAVCAHYIADAAGRTGLDPLVVGGLRLIEFALAGLDAFCVLSLTGFAAHEFVTKLWKERRR